MYLRIFVRVVFQQIIDAIRGADAKLTETCVLCEGCPRTGVALRTLSGEPVLFWTTGVSRALETYLKSAVLIRDEIFPK